MYKVISLGAFAVLACIFLVHTEGSYAAGGGTHSFLPMVVSNPSPTGTAWGTETTSGFLINQAQVSGTIGADTAMLYEVYSAYGDPRLPSQYQGAVPFDYASTVGRDLFDHWVSLTLTTQNTIQPFLLPPIYAGSWGDPNFITQTAQGGVLADVRSGSALTTTCTQWYQPPDTNGLVYLDSTHFRVWYWKDGFANGFRILTATQTLQDATLLRDEAENVYTKETALFGKTPVSDAGKACNGGDGRYDIYIYDDIRGRDAATLPYTPYDTSTCTPTPTWTMMNPIFVHAWTQSETDYARDAFAHEFAHVLDWAYDRPKSCHEYNWLSEAMGNAMIDYVYPADNIEQNWPDPISAAPDWYYTVEHQVPLEQAWHGDVNGYNGYADYMFLFDLAHRLGNWSLMKTIWDNATTMGSIDAIDSAIPGGFAQQWPIFAADGWNPYDDDPTHQYDFFLQWDQMVKGEKYSYENEFPNTQNVRTVDLHGGTSQTVNLMDDRVCPDATCKDVEASLGHLSIHYDYLKFPDDNARSIAVYNGFTDAGPDFAPVHVEVLVKIGGQWQPPRDLTGQTGTNYCRDVTAERVQEMLVVWSNVSKTTDITDLLVSQLTVHPKLVATNVGCWRWTGTFSGTDTKSQPSLSQTWSGTVTYEREPPSEYDLYNVQSSTYYTVAAASVHWQISSGPQAGDCTYSGDATFTVPGNIDSSYGYLWVNSYTDGGYYASFGYLKQWPATYTEVCPDGSTVNPWPTIWQLLATTPGATVSSDGTTIQGDLSGTNYNGVYHWSFTAERQ